MKINYVKKMNTLAIFSLPQDKRSSAIAMTMPNAAVFPLLVQCAVARAIIRLSLDILWIQLRFWRAE